MAVRSRTAPEAQTVRGQLAIARARLTKAGLPTPWLDAEVLLAKVLHQRREWLHSYPEARLTAVQRTRFARLVAQRVRRVPVPYLTGEREFYGLMFRVTPAVLIPRPETERLVECAIGWLAANPQARSVIDLGTGSGAIAIAIARAVARVRVLAIDVSSAAVAVARRNARDHRVSSRVRVEQRNLLAGVRKTDLMLANLPYLRHGRRRSWPKELRYEPLNALDGGGDGLDLIREALRQAPAVMRPGGCLILECDPGQVNAIGRLARESWPAARVSTYNDLAGLDRVVQIQL